MGRTASATDIAEFFKEGFQFFQVPTELVAMAAGARPIVEAAAKIQPAR